MIDPLMNRRKFLLGASLTAMVYSSPSLSTRTQGPAGTAILNGFNSVAGGDYPYKNLLLAAPNPSAQGGTFAFPGLLDANGYPVAKPVPSANNISCGQVPVPSGWHGNYVLGWTGKGKFVLDRGSPGFTVLQGREFVTGGTNYSITASGINGRIVFRPTTTVIKNIPFYFVTTTANAFDGTLSTMYLCRDNGNTPGGPIPNGGDEANILRGDVSNMFNDDFVSALSALNPFALRVMDFCNINNSNVSQPWSLRRPLTSFSFGTTTTTGVGSHWPPGCWVGQISGTDQYTCHASPSTPAGWTHGETFQGQFGGTGASTVWSFTSATAGTSNGNGGKYVVLNMASTSGLFTGQPIAFGFGYVGGGAAQAQGNWRITVLNGTQIQLTANLKTRQPSVWVANSTSGGTFSTATINVNGRGAKLLVWGANGGGGSLTNGGQITNNSISTMSYDSDFDAVFYTPGSASGLASGPPIEAIVALANIVNAGLWYCFPMLTTDAEITSIVSYVSVNLKSASHAFFEVGNEVWNPSFGNTGLSLLKGLNLGFVAASNRAIFGYYALRVVQVMKLVKTAWGNRAGLHTVMATQAFGGGGISQPINVFRFQGADLAPAGNATYAASSISEGVDYTAAPNRPIDLCTDVSYATYYSGAQCANADANYSSLAGISGSSNLLGQAANYVTGESANIAKAFAFLDNDIRKGTLNGVLGGQTLLALDTKYAGGGLPNGIYPNWENICASYDESRLANGLAKLQVSCYEGGCEIWAVTATRLAALGDGNSVTNATNVAALIVGYKNSTLFQQLVIDQLNQMLGKFAGSPNFDRLSHSKHPCWYTFGSGSQWSLYPGDLYSIPWLSYEGVRQFNRDK